jgi:hypothetical protein
MNILKRVEWLEAEILKLKRRATVGGGGVPPSAHATNHSDGGSDEIDITDLGGFPGDPSQVLLGDGSFGALASQGQWIPSPVGAGPMLLNAEGHPVLVWWDGP